MQLGNHAATGAGMSAAPTSLADGVNVVDKIDSATKEKTSGTLMTFDGGELGW
jgi:norsolorinic acid ketoreductase